MCNGIIINVAHRARETIKYILHTLAKRSSRTLTQPAQQKPSKSTHGQPVLMMMYLCVYFTIIHTTTNAHWFLTPHTVSLCVVVPLRYIRRFCALFSIYIYCWKRNQPNRCWRENVHLLHWSVLDQIPWRLHGRTFSVCPHTQKILIALTSPHSVIN